jgi:hypothetical protein
MQLTRRPRVDASFSLPTAGSSVWRKTKMMYRQRTWSSDADGLDQVVTAELSPATADPKNSLPYRLRLRFIADRTWISHDSIASTKQLARLCD